MRICLNKKANNNFARAECKRERKEGQSLCHGCVAEGVYHKECELDIPVNETPRAQRERYRATPPPEPRASRPLSARGFADVWYSSTATTTVAI